MKVKNIGVLVFSVCLAFCGFSVFTASAQNLTFDAGFAPTVDGGFVSTIAVQTDGKITIGGTFVTVGGANRYKIARLNTDGSLDTSFDATAAVSAAHSVNTIKILPNGKYLLSGYFGDVGLNNFKRVVRLNSDGTLDAAFTSFPYTFNAGTVASAESLPNGKILMCGDFASANGSGRSYLARYNADGSFDQTFQTTLDAMCKDTAVLPDGKVLVGGIFSTVGGAAQKGLARFNQDGSFDTTFSVAPTNGNVYKLAVQPDGKIVAFAIGGDVVNGFTSKLIRLNADGSTQNAFSISVAGVGVQAIAFQTNGKFLIGGNNITDANGATTRFTRLNAGGGYDLTLNPLNFSDDVKALAVQADGKILVGGLFQTVNGASRPRLARFVPSQATPRTAFDFDGDGKADVSVFRPSNGTWYLNRSTAGFYAAPFGIATDQPIAADYDGDFKTDIAVFRKNADSTWYILQSATNTLRHARWGASNLEQQLLVQFEMPLPGDYDGDGKADLAVWRLTDDLSEPARFLILQSSNNANRTEQWGAFGDSPVRAADYDGDGLGDLTVRRGGVWYIRLSQSNEIRAVAFGTTADKAVPADYDGDGKADVAVFRDGVWYLQRSSLGFTGVQFGAATDQPVPADYDGDGKADIAVYRDGTWYQLRSNGNILYAEQFGAAGDVPIPAQ